MRQSRKLDHLKYAILLADGPASTGFEDVSLIHNCLPDLSWRDIDLETSIAGIHLEHPVIINAITGGAVDVTEVNAQIARLAKATRAIMAVGSQYAALEDPQVIESYKIIRKINPDGLCLANLGAHVTPKQAREAVDMINACGLQIHLNIAQEIFMAEGDRNFSGYLTNIANIVEASNVPVIIKEVGCGIARRQADMLVRSGVRVIDVGGAGGTNFLAIEARRRQLALPNDILSWGIPTVISAIEVSSIKPDNVDLIVSGGIRTAHDAVKALAIGGKAIAIAAPIIRLVKEKGMEGATQWFNAFLDDIKRYMILTGAKNIEELSSQTPFVIGGRCREWLNDRGIDVTKYARR